MPGIDRRKFLAGSAGLAAALAGCRATPKDEPVAVAPTTEPSHGLGAEEVDAPTMRDGRPALRAMLAEADGSPLADARAKLLHVRDLNNDPLPQAIASAAGRARIELSRAEPIQLVCRLKVPGFGEVYCCADNEGRGYTRATNIDFVTDAARTRARRVTEAHRRLKPTGLALTRGFHEHLERASLAAGKVSASQAYDALSHGLHAGEMLTLAAARHRIARLEKPRDDFYFGVMVSGYATLGPAYERLIREAFNFATVAWYTWKNEQPPEQRIDYARMDSSIEWCLQRGITPKTFGYLYMARGATPEWIRPIETPGTTQPSGDETPTARRAYNDRWSYDKLKELYTQVVRQTMARYRDKPVPFAEIMNEAHDKANLWHMSHEQILDMARSVFAAAREANPTIKRQMNHCCMWAEYAKNRNLDGSRRSSPWQFVRTCFDNGIDYETIGLQLYYPQYDLFEIERMFDRFEVFNRPIHVTEMATASQDGLDAVSMRPNTAAPGWHGPWSPTMQADWAEGIYTLLYSKPYVQCAGWWDFTDVKGHFWPFGGLVDRELKPKESYLRLRKLQKDWGVAMKSANAQNAAAPW